MLAEEMPDGRTAEIFDHWQTALMQTLQEMSSEDALLLTGSLYFISDVRAYFKDNDDQTAD